MRQHERDEVNPEDLVGDCGWTWNGSRLSLRRRWRRSGRLAWHIMRSVRGALEFSSHALMRPVERSFEENGSPPHAACQGRVSPGIVTYASAKHEPKTTAETAGGDPILWVLTDAYAKNRMNAVTTNRCD